MIGQDQLRFSNPEITNHTHESYPESEVDTLTRSSQSVLMIEVNDNSAELSDFAACRGSAATGLRSSHHEPENFVHRQGL